MHKYYYFYLKLDNLESIIRLYNNYEWVVEYVRGDDDLSDVQFDSYHDIDDIIDLLHNDFDVVEEIDVSEINDYINK